MERVRRLARFWNWLPAFRAVAETEHLPTASERFLLSAPALSRAVGLLEQDLGHKLFRKSGRRIELTPAGHDFLGIVRNAMRLVHEGLLALDQITLEGPIYIASAGASTTAYVIPAVDELVHEHPALVPVVLTIAPAEVPHKLLRGELDVSFHSTPLHHAELKTEHLGAVPRGIYCGPGHALYSRTKISLDEVLEHTFVAPPLDKDGLALDGWPVTPQRRFGMHVDQMRIGSEVCAEGRHLAVLPAPVAAEHDVLFRLPLDIVPDDDLFVTLRPNLGMPGRAEAIAQAVRVRMGS